MERKKMNSEWKRGKKGKIWEEREGRLGRKKEKEGR